MQPYFSMTNRSDPHVVATTPLCYSEASSASEPSETIGAIAMARFISLKAPADSHFGPEDILRIGNRCLGLKPTPLLERLTRHALNISFCNNEIVMESKKAIFAELDKKTRSGEDCTDLIKAYELAVTEYIQDSIAMHVTIIFPGTYASLLDRIATLQFQIIAPSYIACKDPSNKSYRGLGRFPSKFIPDEPATVLNPILKSELDLPQDLLQKEFSDANESFEFTSYLAAHYRKGLLNHLRSADFDPARFWQYS